MHLLRQISSLKCRGWSIWGIIHQGFNTYQNTCSCYLPYFRFLLSVYKNYFKNRKCIINHINHCYNNKIIFYFVIYGCVKWKKNHINYETSCTNESQKEKCFIYIIYSYILNIFLQIQCLDSKFLKWLYCLYIFLSLTQTFIFFSWVYPVY